MVRLSRKSICVPPPFSSILYIDDLRKIVDGKAITIGFGVLRAFGLAGTGYGLDSRRLEKTTTETLLVSLIHVY